jgi:hypothetical protein
VRLASPLTPMTRTTYFASITTFNRAADQLRMFFGTVFGFERVARFGFKG